MLGRFLEIGVHAPDIQASLAFYESLGFIQAPVGESWPHPYAVVTDGRLFLGLHARPESGAVLTFASPQLTRRIERLEALGVSFEERVLGDDVFNHASFRDPTGLRVALLEARTFSPPPPGAVLTACGYFTEFAIPVRDVASVRAFWEPLGFVALEEEQQPFPRTSLTSDHLNLAFYRTRAFRTPLLTFEDPAMRERIARLRELGLTLTDEMPDGLDETANAVLIAPEGSRLLLLEADQ
ncbi:MAG TPA: VOC family protein [Steroidobacter sp.]|jgi:catechol 2,3-dioxygenase-like lactoylglutathione lyase family enzyme|nr:hypothetical protein [Steroidobacteraceae bacterium]HLS79873.1 VOC family protein [Steroidobacter sp.]